VRCGARRADFSWARAVSALFLTPIAEKLLPPTPVNSGFCLLAQAGSGLHRLTVTDGPVYAPRCSHQRKSRLIWCRGREESFWCWHLEPQSSCHPDRVPLCRARTGQVGASAARGSPNLSQIPQGGCRTPPRDALGSPAPICAAGPSSGGPSPVSPAAPAQVPTGSLRRRGPGKLCCPGEGRRGKPCGQPGWGRGVRMGMEPGMWHSSVPSLSPMLLSAILPLSLCCWGHLCDGAGTRAAPVCRPRLFSPCQ